jgi:ATP-dependent Clp protease ATP-binding subunit ClpA
MSMFIRYIEGAKRPIVHAKHEADRFGSLEIDPEHILLALLSDPVLISRTMEGISEKEILDTINAHLPRREPNTLPHDLELSRSAREALVLAEREADKFGHQYIRNEHVLLGLAQSESSYAAELLKQKGISADKLRLQIKALPEEKVQEAKRDSKEASAEERKFLETIRRVGQLVSRGEGRSALQLLDDFMAEPGQDKLRMSLLHFAAVTAMQVGDLKIAQRYCEERLSYTPQNPMALYALADCLARQGEIDEAGRRAADCRRAALSRGDEQGKGIVELVEKRFPELKGQP